MKYCLFLLCCPLITKAQLCRYSERIFPASNKTANIIYGNAPAITSTYISESVTTNQDLKLDFFEPAGDTATKRALIIFAHSGGFINGTKDNQDMQALCDSFTHRGYVTSSIDYRLNFNLLSSSSSERAVWRGVQDASAAVRFFKHNAATYKIDTSNIFIWGSSAGSFLALGLAYIDNAERPPSTFSSFLQPDLGCKDCSGNNYAHNSNVTGVISCWGATKDTSWIHNNNNIPVQLFHGSSDGTVPYTEGYPFGLPTITYVRGSQEINEQLNRTSIYHEFYTATGQGHEYWGTSNGTFIPAGPTAYWNDIINKAKLFMIGRMGTLIACGLLPLRLTGFKGNITTEKINLFWNTLSELNTKNIIVERSGDGVLFYELAKIIPKGVNGNGAAYSIIDYHPFSGFNYYRLKVIDLDGNFSYSDVIKLVMPEKELVVTQLFPTPVFNLLHLQLQSGKRQIVKFSVFDITGKFLESGAFDLKEGMNDASISFGNLAGGIYFIHVKNWQGIDLGTFKIVKV